MPVAAARPHSDAVAAMADAADLLLGRGEAPDGSGWQDEDGASVYKGFAVLFPSPGLTDADLADPNRYLIYSAQFNCYAASQEGAEAVADAVKSAYVGVRLTVTGRSSYLGQLLLDRPATRVDSVSPPVHCAVVQISWRTQPT